MSETDPTRAEDPRESAGAERDPAGAERAADDWSAQLAAAEARAEEQREAYLRAAAEIENLRRRAAREVESARQFGAERLAGSLLPVVDSLELGLKAADRADPATLIEGQQATLRLLLKALEAAGISELDPAGQSFDPNLHEAMVAQPSADQPADTVLSVVQKGYLLNGRLLRPARVIVARAVDA
jgi:molecular chaperone GrpE